LTLYNLIFRYSLFAILATCSNLVSQRLVLGLGNSDVIFIIALSVGTFVGLFLKYILDKRWIFKDTSTGIQGKKFSLYTAMGIVTTLIFWGVETTFWLIWQSNAMRELGAVIGLSIGYTIKYGLDRRFVFTDVHSRSSS
jgi:putative flippase GtrA